MLRSVIITTVVSATATVAIAADLPRNSAAPAPFNAGQSFAPVSTWSGFYAGVNIGAGWANNKQSEFVGPGTYFLAPGIASVQAVAASQTIRGGSFTGGFQLGYNWQVNNSFVLGVEGDINGFTNSTKSASSVAIYPGAATAPVTGAFTLTQSVKNNWMGTLRARAGYSYGSALFYVTGGLAAGGVTFSRTFSDTQPILPQGASTSSTKVGWALGAGLEYAIDRNWSIKGEYLFANLGTISNSGFVGTPGNLHLMSGTTTLHRQMARIGVNYRF